MVLGIALPEPPTLALIGVAAAFVAWKLHRMRGKKD